MLNDLSIEELRELNKEFAKDLCYSKLGAKDRKSTEECMFLVKDLIIKKRDGFKNAKGIFSKISE